MAVKFGPGTLSIGQVGSEIDCEALVNSARITSEADAGDPTTKLSGLVLPGSRTYSWEFTGNVDIDPDDGAAGLFALSQLSYGTEVAFTFIPNEADGAGATGTLIIDPLDFGADEYGTYMTSDFTWALVDKPTFTWGAAGLETRVGAGDLEREPVTVTE